MKSLPIILGACAAAALMALPHESRAQSARVVNTCSAQTYTYFSAVPLSVLPNGDLCTTKGTANSSNAPYVATPDGSQQITLTTSALGFTAPTGATFCYIITETQAIRYRTDGTNPTASVGVPLATGTQLLLSIADLTKYKAIAQTGTATENVDCYN